MKKDLIDVIFASDKRKNVLLSLKDGEKEMDDILRSLDTTRQALLPQIRILEEHYLVSHLKDRYRLTTIGKLLADDVAPLLDTIEAFGNNIDYWGTHYLDFIPSDLLQRFSQMKHCEIITPRLVDLYEVNPDFIERSKISASLFFIFTFMHPSFPYHISQFIKSDTNTLIIITEQLLTKLKEDWREEANSFIASGKVSFYLYQSDLKMVSLSVSDFCLALRVLSQNKDYDNTQIFCCDPQAQQWGKELFEHYLKDSVPIKEI